MSPRVNRHGSRRWRGVRDDDQGGVSAELVVAVPVLLLLILLIAQFAIWAHASNIAQAAASRALSAARVQQGSSDAGRATAGQVLSQLGQGPLHATHVRVQRGAERSTVVITGQAASVVPFLSLPVRARAVGASERFVAPGAAT